MSFSPAFTVSQTAADPSLVVFTDTSTGSDVAITSRRIYVVDSQGNYIVPSGTATNYISWPLATNPLSSYILSQDTACEITVQWLNVGGTVLYTSTEKYCLNEYGRQFFYYLISVLAASPSILQDLSYKNNLNNFYTYLIGAENAVQLADDIAASQQLLNLETNMQNNQQMYF